MKEDVNKEVSRYWGDDSCGTNRTDADKYSLKYYEEIEEFRYSVEPFIFEFAQFTRWYGKKVLEVGVGAGTDFLQFARAGAECFGVDLTEEGIKNASTRLSLYGLPPATLEQCNAEELPFDDDTFDLIYSWGVIHHAHDMRAIFDEIYRVAKPGASIKIMVYHRFSLHVLYMYLRYALFKGKLLRGPGWAVYNYQESYGTKVYTPSDIRRLLEGKDFENLSFKFWNQRIRRNARLSKLRRALNAVTPQRFSWYMGIEYRKSKH